MKVYSGSRVGKTEEDTVCECRKIQIMEKSLRHMIGGNVVSSFSVNFIKGEMKIKSIKILKRLIWFR